MARGTQLIQLVGMLRDEVNRANSVAVGTDDIAGLKRKLKRTQELLYDDYDWPFLRQVFPQKTLNAGEQYYDFPDGLNLERVESVYVWYGNFSREIDRGISVEDYAVYNSQSGVRSEPAWKWDVRWTGTKDQFEIWPVPVTNTQTIQFVGIRSLRPLIADADVADLDDEMVVLFAAAEMLARQGSEQAPIVLKTAQTRIGRMKGRAKGASRTRRMGLGGNDTPDRRIPIIVHARPS